MGLFFFMYTHTSRLVLFLTLMHLGCFSILLSKSRVRVSCRRNLFAQSVLSGLLTATKRMQYNYKGPVISFYFSPTRYYPVVFSGLREVFKNNR